MQISWGLDDGPGEAVDSYVNGHGRSFVISDDMSTPSLAGFRGVPRLPLTDPAQNVQHRIAFTKRLQGIGLRPRGTGERFGPGAAPLRGAMIDENSRAQRNPAILPHLDQPRPTPAAPFRRRGSQRGRSDFSQCRDIDKFGALQKSLRTAAIVSLKEGSRL
jgi:hypothetical protein